MKNKLKFSADGNQFQIIFKSEDESNFFTSKEAGFKAITDLAKKKKITVEEFTEMRDQILEAKDLKWSESDAKPGRGRNIGMGLAEILFFLSLGGLDGIEIAAFRPKKPVDVAYFEMCECGQAHGRIFSKNAMTTSLASKEEANEALTEMAKKGYVSEEETAKVKEEIEKSTLPKKSE